MIPPGLSAAGRVFTGIHACCMPPVLACCVRCVASDACMLHVLLCGCAQLCRPHVWPLQSSLLYCRQYDSKHCCTAGHTCGTPLMGLELWNACCTIACGFLSAVLCVATSSRTAGLGDACFVQARQADRCRAWVAKPQARCRLQPLGVITCDLFWPPACYAVLHVQSWSDG
jgi:hypothetical protein